MMTYVIIYCGYEGIECLLWAGQNADEARQHVIDYRARCARTAAVRQSKRYGRIAWKWENLDEPDRVCVMSQTEGGDFLTCCCAALLVQPNERVFM